MLESEFGVTPVEIKLSQHVDARSLRVLRDVVAERNCRYGIVINNDEQPRRLDDRLIRISLGAL